MDSMVALDALLLHSVPAPSEKELMGHHFGHHGEKYKTFEGKALISLLEHR